MNSLILGKKKTTTPAQKEPDLATIWVFVTLIVGGATFMLFLFRGRFGDLDRMATFLLAWGCMIGVVPIPLQSQVHLAKLPPGVISGLIRICVGFALTIYVIATFLFCLVAVEAITWQIFLAPFRLGMRAMEIMWTGNFGSPVR